jgi:hypothetical protein
LKHLEIAAPAVNRLVAGSSPARGAGSAAVTVAVTAYREFKADRIVAERNFGDDMVRAVLHTVDPNISVQLVTASRGKAVRAEPVSALYGYERDGCWHKDQVRHVGKFPELEDQMLNFSTFLFGRVGTLLGWRSAFVIAGILGAAGVLIAWAALPRGDSGRTPEPQPLLDFRPVLANRDVLALIVGYAAAIWGCVGLRQWIVVFLTFCAGEQAADPAQAWIILGVGAVISFLGVPAGLIGNELSIRYGLRTIATLVFVLSAVAGGLFGFTAMLPYIAVLGVSVIAGFIVQGNFSNLTSGVLAVAAPRYRGATIGLYSCIGFGASFLGTLLFGVTLDQFGGTSQVIAWILSFGTCGLACLIGGTATIFLPRNIWQR